MALSAGEVEFLFKARDEATATVQKLSSQMGLLDKTVAGVTSRIGEFAAGFTIGAIIDRVVTSVVRFASESIDLAGAMVDLSDKTGLSTDTLQKFSFMATQTGGSLESFTQAAYMLGIRLAGGDDSVVGALHKLKLGYGAIMALSPDRQFEVIARALGAVENSQERNRIGFELFGRSFQSIAGAIASGYDEMAAKAQVSSEDQLKAVDKIQDAWGGFWNNMKLKLGAAAGTIFLPFTLNAERMAQAAEDSNKRWSKSIATVDDANRDLSTALDMSKVSIQLVDGAMRVHVKTTDDLKRETQAAKKAQEDFDERLTKARKTLYDWNHEVEQTNLRILGSMATWSDFTAAIGKYTDRIGKSIIDMAVARRNYENELDALVRGRAMTRIQLEIDAVNRWAANEKLKLDATVENYKDAVAAIEALRIKRIEFITEEDVAAQRILFANIETEAARTAAATAQTLKKTLMTTLQGIPQIIANTLANGGSWTEATAGIVSSIGTGLGALGGFLIGGPWGAAIGGAIGSLAGLVVEPISRIFGGVSRATREANEQLTELRTRLLQVHGGMDGLQAAAQRVGLSFTEAFMVQGERGLRMMNKMIADLEARTKAIEEATTHAVQGLGAVIEAITGPWIAAGKAIGEASDATRQTLADLGTQAMATFAAVLIQTGSFAQAIRAVGPSLTQLVEAYRVLGVKVEDVGLQHLMLQAQILQANPTLIAGIDGLSISMQGLAQMGLLNTETFGGMQRTGMEMYTRLQAAVFATGGATRDALLPMQDYLHQAATQAALLGLPLDANTQMLIDQSRELGIWREQGASATDRLIDGMSALVERVGALIDQLLGVSGAITAIPNRTVDVTVRTSYETIGDRRDDEWNTGVPGFEGGTRGQLMDFGEGTLVELHGRERVQTAAEVAASGSGDPEEIARAIVAGLEAYLPRAMARAMREAWQTA